MYNVLDLSQYIILKCINDGYPINNLQLQKILYYIQKDFLSKGTVAFDDDIEAWQFGPVVPSVYYQYCGCGSSPIFIPEQNQKISILDSDVVVIDNIIDEKRQLKPWQMVRETQKPNSAWAQIYNDGKGSHHIIPINLIMEIG